MIPTRLKALHWFALALIGAGASLAHPAVQAQEAVWLVEDGLKLTLHADTGNKSVRLAGSYLAQALNADGATLCLQGLDDFWRVDLRTHAFERVFTREFNMDSFRPQLTASVHGQCAFLDTNTSLVVVDANCSHQRIAIEEDPFDDRRLRSSILVLRKGQQMQRLPGTLPLGSNPQALLQDGHALLTERFVPEESNRVVELLSLPSGSVRKQTRGELKVFDLASHPMTWWDALPERLVQSRRHIADPALDDAMASVLVRMADSTQTRDAFWTIAGDFTLGKQRITENEVFSMVIEQGKPLAAHVILPPLPDRQDRAGWQAFRTACAAFKPANAAQKPWLQSYCLPRAVGWLSE